MIGLQHRWQLVSSLRQYQDVQGAAPEPSCTNAGLHSLAWQQHACLEVWQPLQVQEAKGGRGGRQEPAIHARHTIQAQLLCSSTSMRQDTMPQ